jgi:hypothetical protein
MSDNAIFLIEGGKALELVKQHIADKRRVADQVRAYAQELGVENVTTHKLNGRLGGVVFKNKKAIHPDFTKPDDKGVSYPKKRSDFARRLEKEHTGYPDPVQIIAEAFGIPLQVSANYADGTPCALCRIGSAFFECGFMWLSPIEGPFALWIPDIAAEVADLEEGDKRLIVNEPAKSFVMEFDGCRRLEQEEWDIIVATDKLAKKHAAGTLITQQVARKAA